MTACTKLQYPLRGLQHMMSRYLWEMRYLLTQDLFWYKISSDSRSLRGLPSYRLFLVDHTQSVKRVVPMVREWPAEIFRRSEWFSCTAEHFTKEPRKNSDDRLCMGEHRDRQNTYTHHAASKYKKRHWHGIETAGLLGLPPSLDRGMAGTWMAYELRISQSCPKLLTARFRKKLHPIRPANHMIDTFMVKGLVIPTPPNFLWLIESRFNFWRKRVWNWGLTLWKSL